MKDKIKCPNCNFEFGVEEALSSKLEARIEAKYARKNELQNKRFKEWEAQFDQEKQEFQAKKARENQIFKERLEQRVAQEVTQKSQKIQQQTEATFKQQITSLKQENENRKAENLKLKAKEVQLLEKERELKDKEEDIKLKYQREFIGRQQAFEDKVRNQEREKNLLQKKEDEKKIADLNKLIDEMKRKSEQGSTQLQGEIQELALEELLRRTYPFDSIIEVPKGVRGADCIQTVINRAQQSCGSIVYESKRTKSFSRDWIGKLKQDQIRCKADIAVIVTETLPANTFRFGQIDGVWICGFHEVKSVSLVLREILLQRQSVKTAQENKGDKMEMLYNYLTSSEFIQKVERVMEVHTEMSNQLEYEKRAFERIWKKREAQIDLIKENVAGLLGSIQGIAGKEVETPSILELGGGL